MNAEKETSPRGYSKATIQRVMSLTEDSISVNLAKACVKANLPPGEVAKVLGVTRTTLNSWFKGTNINQSRRDVAQKLLVKLRADLEEGHLPLAGRNQSVDYLREISLD
jgi:DNA-binding XRE family transcriptional regulator